jgi:hypothetical protein
MWWLSGDILFFLTLSLPVSQAGCSGNTFLIRIRLVQGEGASGPPVMLKRKKKCVPGAVKLEQSLPAPTLHGLIERIDNTGNVKNRDAPDIRSAGYTAG